VETTRAKGGQHYDVHCTRCRTVNKVPLKQLQKAGPPPAAPAKGAT
jgi:phage FluMu protein Com